jgi:hypothetical protein
MQRDIQKLRDQGTVIEDRLLAVENQLDALK